MWFIIQNIYGIISIILYIIVTFLVLKERRHFSSSFVTLFVVFAFVNILSYVALYMALGLPVFTQRTSLLAPLFENFPLPSILPYFTFLCYYLPYCQYITNLLFVFSGFRAVAFPFAKESVLEAPISLVVIFLFPLPLCYDLPFADAHYMYRESCRGYVLISTMARNRERLLYLVIFECSLAFLGLTINALGIYPLLRRTLSPNKKKETRLFLVSCICFLFQLLNAITMLSAYVFPPSSQAITFSILALPICNDLNSLGYPYYFLLLNSRIRKRFVDLLHCCSKYKISPVIGRGTDYTPHPFKPICRRERKA